MKLSAARVSGLVALGLFAASCRSTSERDHGAEPASLRAAKQQFYDAWTKQAGEPFDPSRVAAIVDDGAVFLSFDAFSPESTTIDSRADYLRIWSAGMNGFTTARMTEARALSAWTSGDGALTTSIVHVHGEMPDGKVLDTDAHLTLGWRRSEAGWRVVHEHMSTGVKP